MFGLSKLSAIAGAIAAALVVAPLAYMIGDWNGSSKEAAVARMQAQLIAAQSARDAAQADLRSATLAETLARQTADANRRLMEDAQERANDYELELKKRGDADRCVLNLDDALRMRHPDHDAARAPASGR